METPPHVPYQAYRSKRHSRTVSTLPLLPNVAPPTISRPSSVISTASISIPPALNPQSEFFDTEKVSTDYPGVVAIVPHKTPVVDLVPPPTKDLPLPPSTNGSSVSVDSSPNTSPDDNETHDAPPAEYQPTMTNNKPPSINGKSKEVDSSSTSPSTKQSTPKKTSTFRRVPGRPSATRSPLPSSPLRLSEPHSRVPSTSSTSTRQFDQAPRSPALHSRVTSLSSVISDDKPHSSPPTADTSNATPRHHHSHSSTLVVPQPQSQTFAGTIQPPPRSSSMLSPPRPPPKSISPASTSLSLTPSPSPFTSPAASNPALPHHPAPPRPSAPYRPGFQPKGVYRPRTDEFAESRRARKDEGRVERTKLERRLEKLIALHFPLPDASGSGSGPATSSAGLGKAHAPGLGKGQGERRASLFDLASFDFGSLMNVDAGELWKGVLHSQTLQGPKSDIRAAEQRITPWQEDSAVSKCPLCTASFHPLTNRKHHCRLCGQIICSLPPKQPQRPEVCSVLFVVDTQTRRIEEVGEGVDYGVRRRGGSVGGKGTGGKGAKGKGKEVEEDEEKFLKGVRICRSCRPVLAREQYYQEVARVPGFVRLYEAFVELEKDIEESLPQFQELLLTLNTDSPPTKEASLARKRLLDAFAAYDALSKRIRALPCPPGSSQDRVQHAISTRAGLFLQKHMFPLQSLPKPKPTSSQGQGQGQTPLIDPTSSLAHALQPLLEQEALLESFVAEATAQRKFEDAKTLRANLAEIRGEIERMVENGEGRIG
ncbi:hypothetical protein HYDPIDRAFT_29511 [Hydnomerulius pinastri MD-312]|uniref:FYVE-type domain-containing protein n=1 Tax=Hydnomerulius pinastri MD-312 TaxID=994086 RepID=A0A0C9W7N5_9AGAM|nr:hypothetical protein HYDPIDRAFT_29511 [Hydnomerulius pinastri MD-312]